ncbi:7979_t:CDS:1, partial [Scutellospora calospora]
ILIKDLVPDNWVEYLRKYLKNKNSITTPSENIIEIIKNRLNNNCNAYITNNGEFQGPNLIWELKLCHKSVIITVIEFDYSNNKWNSDSNKKQLEIFSSFCPDETRFILHCEILENGDFVMITHIGVIIWTFKLSKAKKTKVIKMHYYWCDYNYRLEDFDFEITNLRISLKTGLQDKFFLLQ